MRSSLHVRLKRLEALQRPRVVRPTVMFAIYAADAPGEPVGASSMGRTVKREAGEPLPTFIARAGAVLGERIVCAVYRDTFGHG